MEQLIQASTIEHGDDGVVVAYEIAEQLLEPFFLYSCPLYKLWHSPQVVQSPKGFGLHSVGPVPRLLPVRCFHLVSILRQREFLKVRLNIETTSKQLLYLE